MKIIAKDRRLESSKIAYSEVVIASARRISLDIRSHLIQEKAKTTARVEIYNEFGGKIDSS